jgi:hypothetical protein
MQPISYTNQSMSINALVKPKEMAHNKEVRSKRSTTQPINTMQTDEAMADFYARNASKPVYATSAYSPRKKLGKVTWVLGEQPNKGLQSELLWADKRRGR